MSVSVIVCTRDRPELVRDTIESILAGARKPDELVVVDQSRQPDSRFERRHGEDVRYVWTQTRGLCRARNIGVAVARGDVVVFSDDDVLVDPNWLKALVDTIGAEEERVVAAGQVIPTGPERPGGFTSSFYVDDQPSTYEGRIGRDPLGGGNMAIHRSAFDVVGPFDERLGAGGRYPAADDNDFGLRLLEAGFRIAYVPAAVVHHRAWRPRRDYVVVRWRYGRGKGGFYAKHFGLSDSHIKRRLARDVRHRLRRLPRNVLLDPRLAAGDLAYLAGIATGLAQWLATERNA